MEKHALITGITGQDGSYLAEFLLTKGYRVFGLIRRSSAGPNLRNISNIVDQVELLQGDMTDSDSLKRAIDDSEPNEIYNLAAQSFVPMSWSSPTYTMNVNSGGFIYLLEAVRNANADIKVYQASTSEMYGNAGLKKGNPISDPKGIALNEESPMRPRSPYGVSKLSAHRMARVYRESFHTYVACGILFNHESPRRGDMFVTRKITKAVARIVLGKQDRLDLGDLNARRDWGFAGDYVKAMWMMLQRDKAQDFVIGTGITHSVEDVAAYAFDKAQELSGAKLDKPWHAFVQVQQKYFRPAEIFILKAGWKCAREILGWKPDTTFEGLIEMMVENDLREEAG